MFSRSRSELFSANRPRSILSRRVWLTPPAAAARQIEEKDAEERLSSGGNGEKKKKRSNGGYLEAGGISDAGTVVGDANGQQSPEHVMLPRCLCRLPEPKPPLCAPAIGGFVMDSSNGF